MTQVLFVGTSDAFGSGGRRQSAYLVRARAGSMLVDCGGTTTTGLATLGVERDELDAILVSHFHGDHFGGIPLLLLAACFADHRRRPLVIAGPRGVEERVHAAAGALGHPIDARSLGYPLVFRELEPGAPAQIGEFQVELFGTHHSPDAVPHGVLCRVDGRTIAYSGDTGWFDELPDRVEGADLFICECTQDRRGYEYHLSLEELEAHRERFLCGRMVLTHLGPDMRARKEWADFEVADDGLAIEL